MPLVAISIERNALLRISFGIVRGPVSFRLAFHLGSGDLTPDGVVDFGGTYEEYLRTQLANGTAQVA